MIAALQIIVYAGAIMVLFLFVIMLLNLADDDPERGRRRTVLRGLAWARRRDPRARAARS